MADGVLAEALGRVHERVGGAQHLVHARGRGVPGDDADAECHAPTVLTRHLLELLAHAADDDARRFFVGLRHEDCELVAAETRNNVNGAHVLADGVGDRLEESVAGAVAVAVVDLLEVVHVHEGDCEGVLVPARAVDLGLGQLDERPAVQSVRQVVGARQLALVFEREFEGGDEVREDDHEAEAHRGVPVGDEGAGEVAGRGVSADEPRQAARRAHPESRAPARVPGGDEDGHDVEDEGRDVGAAQVVDDAEQEDQQ